MRATRRVVQTIETRGSHSVVPSFTTSYTYLCVGFIVNHRQFPHKMHGAFSVMVHCSSTPGAGIVIENASVKLAVETPQKRGILLERKCPLFGARRVETQDRTC